MNESKSKQARDMIANAVVNNKEMKTSLKELEDYEMQMAEIAETVLENGRHKKKRQILSGAKRITQ